MIFDRGEGKGFPSMASFDCVGLATGPTSAPEQRQHGLRYKGQGRSQCKSQTPTLFTIWWFQSQGFTTQFPYQSGSVPMIFDPMLVQRPCDTDGVHVICTRCDENTSSPSNRRAYFRNNIVVHMWAVPCETLLKSITSAPLATRKLSFECSCWSSTRPHALWCL